MASQAYEEILHVQALDLSISQLRHRCAHHPIRAKIDEIDGRLAANESAATEVAGRQHELERQQKRLEDEVASITAKRQNIDGKLYGGKVTASKELMALQDEAASLLDRQTRMEDDDLVIMEQVDDLASELAAYREEHTALDRERQDQQAELEAAMAELEAEIANQESQRSAAAGPANPELLAHYEALRDQYDGVPVARLVGSRCDGCHIQLSAVAVDQIARMAEDAVVTCEECGRLLVR